MRWSLLKLPILQTFSFRSIILKFSVSKCNWTRRNLENSCLFELNFNAWIRFISKAIDRADPPFHSEHFFLFQVIHYEIKKHFVYQSDVSNSRLICIRREKICWILNRNKLHQFFDRIFFRSFFSLSIHH